MQMRVILTIKDEFNDLVEGELVAVCGQNVCIMAQDGMIRVNCQSIVEERFEFAPEEL